MLFIIQVQYVSLDGAPPNRSAIKRAMPWAHARVANTNYSLYQPDMKQTFTFIMDIKVGAFDEYFIFANCPWHVLQ